MHYIVFLPRDYCNQVRLHSAALAVVRRLSVTFMYCVKTAKHMDIVAMECESETVLKFSNVSRTIFNVLE